MAWYKGPHIDSACLTTQDTYIRSECTSTNRNKKTLTWGVGGGEERTEKEIEEQRKGEKKGKKTNGRTRNRVKPTFIPMPTSNSALVYY